MRGLYPIVDVDSLRAHGVPSVTDGAVVTDVTDMSDVTEFAEQVLLARPPLLQLRAKHAASGELLALLRALAPVCRAAGTALIANDRADLAVLAQCAGVHIGQDDLPLSVVRLIAPGLIVGVSTHDLEQLKAALAEKPDYVAFGPVYGTASKVGAEPSVGVERLAEAHELAQAAGIPLVAIGGIDLTRALEVAPHCELAAVIAALRPDPTSLRGVADAARALHTALTR